MPPRTRSVSGPAARRVESPLAREGDRDPARGSRPRGGDRKPPWGPVPTASTRALRSAPREGRETTRRVRPARPAPSALTSRPLSTAAAPKGTVNSVPLRPRQPQPGEDPRLLPRRLGPLDRGSDARGHLADGHLDAVGAAGGRGRIAGAVERIGAEHVGAGAEIAGHAGGEGRRTGTGTGLELGRQLGPLLAVEPTVVDLPACRARVGIGDLGADLLRHRRHRPSGGIEGDARRHVIEAQRHRDRRGGRLVARLVAQPDAERVDAGTRNEEVFESCSSSCPAANLAPVLEAGRAHRCARRRRRSDWPGPGRG